MTPPVYVRIGLIFNVGGQLSEMAFATIPLALFDAMRQHPRRYEAPMEGGPAAYLPAMGIRYELHLAPIAAKHSAGECSCGRPDEDHSPGGDCPVPTRQEIAA